MKSALLLALALVLPRHAAAADWEPPVAVSQACCGAYFPHLLHDDAGTPHLWWVQPDEGMDARCPRESLPADGRHMPDQSSPGASAGRGAGMLPNTACARRLASTSASSASSCACACRI